MAKQSKPSRARSATAAPAREQLPESVEKSLEKKIEDAFGSKSAEWKKGAVIYARKILKFERGIRDTKPPVPPQIQTENRDRTRKICVEIATAVGANLVKVGLADEPEPKKEAAKPKAATAAKPKTNGNAAKDKLAATAAAAEAATKRDVKPDPKSGAGKGR